MADYFNTTGATGKQLDEYLAAARGQSAKILAYLCDHPRTPFTPWELHTLLFNERTPITSVRRSLSTLTAQGFLSKLPDQYDGPLGRPEHAWAFLPPIASEPEQAALAL